MRVQVPQGHENTVNLLMQEVVKMTGQNIAIMDGTPFDAWIAIDGNAQQIYKEFRSRYHGDTECMVARDGSFFVRDNNDGFHEVEYVGDFDDTDEWCAACGVYLSDPENWYYCDYPSCDNRICVKCWNGPYVDTYCPAHQGAGVLRDQKSPEYTHPYPHDGGFTFGVEIEIDTEIPSALVERITIDEDEIVAGWNTDQSLGDGGIEVQTDVLDMRKLPALEKLIADIPDCGENAGGHIHVARTANQCASRWYWALRGLNESQCESLNMRHMRDDYWCALNHGEYTGKHTAVNNEHQDTIELRTFDCWYEGSAAKLVPAVKWIRAMWRFFEKHPRGTVKAETIEQYASCMADNVTDTPFVSLERRLEVARRTAAAVAFEQRRIRRERAANTRRRVEANIRKSRLARASHGDTRPARRDWANHENRRALRRESIDACLSNVTSAYAFPSRNLRPLHIYLQMATERIVERGETFRSLELFSIYHAAYSSSIWGGFEYSYNRRDTAQRVLGNILRSRVARASHGKPTTESLERTALRLYKRVGRPELNMRYARIRKNIANVK